MAIEETIAAFRASVTTILLAQDDFIDWAAVHLAAAKSRTAAGELQKLLNSGGLTESNLADALENNVQVYEAALSLIAFMRTGSQISKWGLPERVPSSSDGKRHLASQLLHIGIGKVLKPGVSVEDLLLLAEVYKDSFRRRFRSGEKVETIAAKIVRHALSEANKRLGDTNSLRMGSIPDQQLKRSLDYILLVGERPVIGISVVFQNQSGGRQQRDLATTYPALQEKMLEYGMDLVLIADGQGIREASERTLEALFASVHFPMTLKQAESGDLEDALVLGGSKSRPETIDSGAISRLITEGLKTKEAVEADSLPIARGPAILAFARYFEAHPSLNLELSKEGAWLGWANPATVEEARNVSIDFDKDRLIELFARFLYDDDPDLSAEDGFAQGLSNTPDVPPFTGRVLVVAHEYGRTSEAVRHIGRQALQLAPGSSFAFLLTKNDLSESDINAFRKRQALLPVNIVVIGPAELNRIAQSKNPLKLITDSILNQSDLTKVSPFILSNATPERMFYGREEEAATILSTVGTNSVALLGSRRIGKSSLLRRVRFELEEANYKPFFGDCQTVKTWSDFAALAETEWGVPSPVDFRPPHLRGLVASLAKNSDHPVVILLDEIDQLLEWDKTHTEDSVPEAFFRTCRSISQDGLAQFVFSGERTIAERIWDPHSPHWNFCRPLELRQLTKEAASALLLEPLRAMNIEVSDEKNFADEAWLVTSGHPQIVQYLGDRLVRQLESQVNRKELEIGPHAIRSVAESYDFAEHYLNTYWGQATAFERQVTLEVSDSPVAIDHLLKILRENNPQLDEISLLAAIRMLKLYGIVSENGGKIELKAVWFSKALSYFGTVPTKGPSE